MTAKEALKLLSQDAHSDFKILTEDEREDCFYEIAQALNTMKALARLFGYTIEEVKDRANVCCVVGYVKVPKAFMHEGFITKLIKWQNMEKIIND